jgi:hypothetical protein
VHNCLYIQKRDWIAEFAEFFRKTLAPPTWVGHLRNDEWGYAFSLCVNVWVAENAYVHSPPRVIASEHRSG